RCVLCVAECTTAAAAFAGARHLVDSAAGPEPSARYCGREMWQPLFTSDSTQLLSDSGLGSSWASQNVGGCGGSYGGGSSSSSAAQPGHYAGRSFGLPFGSLNVHPDSHETFNTSGYASGGSSFDASSALKEPVTDWSRVFAQPRLSMSGCSATTRPGKNHNNNTGKGLSSLGASGHGTAATASSSSRPEDYVSNYVARLHLRRLSYPGGATVDFPELAPVLRPVAVANARYRTQAVHAIESGVHVRAALHVYSDCDRDGCGFLTWSNGSIRDFVVAVFHQLGLLPPAETQTYAAHTLFDAERRMCLGARECLCLVDALLRAIFVFGAESEDDVLFLAALGQSLSGTSRSPETSASVSDELAEAQAETERLRQELEELRALEASAESGPPAGLRETPMATAAAAGLPSPSRETAALVWTARAHAENRRLERELHSLKSVARKQRGEVQWLRNVKTELAQAADERELERELEREQQLHLMELRRKEDMTREAAQDLEALIQERKEQGLLFCCFWFCLFVCFGIACCLFVAGSLFVCCFVCR
ncbi:unnamed protein product, partial [Polarella glacialis]